MTEFGVILKLLKKKIKTHLNLRVCHWWLNYVNGTPQGYSEFLGIEEQMSAGELPLV